MGLMDRFKKGFNAFVSSSSGEEAARRFDVILDPAATSEAIEQYIAQKQSESKLDVRKTSNDLALYSIYGALKSFYRDRLSKIPDYEDPSRDIYISDIWRQEPILAGAVYSMTAKMTAMRWTVTGKRKRAMAAAQIFAEAAHMDGYDWGGFIASTAADFYTTNRGVFWETPRIGNPLYGKLAELGHIDSLACNLTGNRDFPMLYDSETVGQVIRFKRGEYIHFASLPSPRERHLGQGFCAVDRAYRALKLLIAVHNYDDEKLNNLPPEGIASVSGLTMEEFNDAVALWKNQRKQDNSLTFPQVLWLIGSSPGAEVNVNISGFSQLPESFDREQVVTHYISTLALDFGVDAREFWPISSGSLGTASESEIQHLKAKGKGPGEFISTVERHLNGELDDDTQFAFDTQDIGEDMTRAAYAKAMIDAYYPLFTGTPAGKSKASPGGKPNTEATPNPEEIPLSDASGQAMSAAGPAAGGPEQVISKDDLLRILADHHVIPEWMMNDKREMVLDTSIHISKELDPDEYTSFVFEKGILKEHRLPPITINSPTIGVDRATGKDKTVYALVNNGKVVDTSEDYTEIMKSLDEERQHDMLLFLKQKEEEIFAGMRKIVGNPIPEGEVVRGTRVTANTLRDELERWRNHPILAPYALTEEELAKMIEEGKKQ
jgi:hypothetical protein